MALRKFLSYAAMKPTKLYIDSKIYMKKPFLEGTNWHSERKQSETVS